MHLLARRIFSAFPFVEMFVLSQRRKIKTTQKNKKQALANGIMAIANEAPPRQDMHSPLMFT
jgi:hypothetical protein